MYYAELWPIVSYQYKGFKRGVAIEGSFSAYEFILEGLFRLQLGFDKGQIGDWNFDVDQYARSEKSSLWDQSGSSPKPRLKCCILRSACRFP